MIWTISTVHIKSVVHVMSPGQGYVERRPEEGRESLIKDRFMFTVGWTIITRDFYWVHPKY